MLSLSKSKVQIPSKELIILSETIYIIKVEETRRRVMLGPQNFDGSAMVAQKVNGHKRTSIKGPKP